MPKIRPKKYEDIYALDFYSEAWPEIWQEMKRVFLFWIDHDVKIFRVDNPAHQTGHLLGMADRGNSTRTS